MADEQRPEKVRGWTAKRRAALILSLLRGETTAEAARRHGLKVTEVEDWRDRFLLGAENALREEKLNPFKRKVGELTIALDILRPAGSLRPLAPARSD